MNIVIVLSVLLVASLLWNVIMYHYFRMLINDMNEEEEKEFEDPNQTKLNFEEHEENNH